MLPLTYASPEAEHIIVKVNGNADVKKHLESLGFVAGGSIRVISSLGKNIIVNVKDTRIAISRDAASKIMVRQ
ncbi:MAG TPA: ferrous iron transport protein A [Firmicutes bacterium]|nr:ferrous iron transport protein A [Bacillota bacterium]